MNVAHCGRLATYPESRTWYRAVAPHQMRSALNTAHTATAESRFNHGRGLFEILYCAEDHTTALFEVRAMLGSPFGVSLPNPFHAWTIVNIKVQLQRVADLTRLSQQQMLDTTAQELTGDWYGYSLRSGSMSLVQPGGVPAPTQELGEALYLTPGIEAFRAISARVPTRAILCVFPQKLQPRSRVEFSDASGKVLMRLPRRRRAR